MKRFKYIFCMLTTIILFYQPLNATDAVITIFIKEKTMQQATARQQIKNISLPLQQPSFVHAISKDRSWLSQPGVDGIYATYLGYITLSDTNGQISFPREQQSETVYLLITPQIAPEFMMSPSLIYNWITIKKAPAVFYKIERKYHEGFKRYYFVVDTQEIPHDVPFNTITIFAHPDHINVTTGISLDTYSPNLVLPELQAQKTFTNKNSLYTLAIKQYFELINIENQYNKANITSMIFNQ